MGFGQLFSETTVTMLKMMAVMAYPIHTILLILSLRKHRSMIDNGHELIEFLPLCCSQDEVEKVGSGEVDDSSVYESMYSTTVLLKEVCLLAGM